jgi:hypothetical protein
MTVIMTITRDSDTSLLEEQRGLGPPLHDFPKQYSAVSVKDTMVAMQTTAAFKVQSHPVFWLAEARDAVVVDDRAFSDLVCVDATGLDAGKKVAIGQFLQPTEMAPRKLAEMLITADVILTWAHIGSELSLTEETSDTDGWAGHFEGTHTYFTNEENVDPLDFWVRVSSKGELVVEGR